MLVATDVSVVFNVVVKIVCVPAWEMVDAVAVAFVDCQLTPGLHCRAR